MQRITIVGLVLAASMGGGGCSGKESTPGDSETTGGASGGSIGAAAGGPSTSSSGSGGAGSSVSVGGPSGAVTCGAACKTDLPAALAALESGDFAGALALYHCADTPEAAFGAGLSRILTATEGGNADAVLADLGLPHLSARDLLGPNSYLAQENARWAGSGTLTLTGDVELGLAFQRGKIETRSSGNKSLSLVDATSGSRANLDVHFTSVPSAGALNAGTALALTYNCTGAYSTLRQDPRLAGFDLSFRRDGKSVHCQIPYSPPAAACATDGGQVVVVDPGVSGGQASTTFDRVLLECTADSGASLFVRATGSSSTFVVGGPSDTSGRHPLFSSNLNLSERIPAGVQLSTLVQHAAGVTGELAEAACYFRKASQGTGRVFTWPGKLHGGADVPFSQGDTEILASSLLAVSAAGQLAPAYEVPIALRDMACDQGSSGCPTERQLVDTFNAVFAQVFHADRFASAERLLGEALELLDSGLDHLDERSLLVKNGVSRSGLASLRELVQSFRTSLGSGAVMLPQVSPSVSLDLRAFFAQARNPAQSKSRPLVFKETCDPYGCSSDTELNAGFLNEHFSGVTDADWANGKYTWANDQAIGDALDEAVGHATSQFFVID